MAKSQLHGNSCDRHALWSKLPKIELGTHSLTCNKMSMSIDYTPISMLAAQLGEEVVLEMAIAYINTVVGRHAHTVTERHIHTPPRVTRNRFIQRRARHEFPLTILVQQTISASSDNLQPLEEAINLAYDDGLDNTAEYIDALSRLDALRSIND